MAKRIISVLSGKGGVGKTTIAVNLSALAAAHSEIVLIDGDLGNPTVGLQLGLWGYMNGLQNVLNGKCKLEQAIIVHPATGIRVVPSSLEYQRGVKTSRFKEVLEDTPHENVMIDSPPGVSSAVEDILAACTETIVVVTPDIPSVMSAVKIIELAEQSKVKVAGLVLNRVQNKSYEMHIKEIESTCDARILTTIAEEKVVPESISARMPAVLYAPRSAVSRSFNDLSVELGFGGQGIIGRAAAGRNPVARFFAWLSRRFGGG